MDLEQARAILNDLFTPAQQIAFAIITIGVMATVQVFKHTFFAFYPFPPNKKKACIWLFAFSAGFLGGISGHFSGMSPQPLWFWIFTGVVSGAAAIGFFKLFIEIVWRKLILRGKKPSA